MVNIVAPQSTIYTDAILSELQAEGKSFRFETEEVVVLRHRQAKARKLILVSHHTWAIERVSGLSIENWLT